MKIKNIKNILKVIIIVILLLLVIPNRVGATSQEVTNRFKDENLKNAILEIVREVTNDNTKQTITTEDIEKITSDKLPGGKQLNLANKNIQDLTGLELFADKNIEWIYLDWNNISDISVLSQFKSLTKISASSNNISNLTPIQNLANLKNINFSNNQIQDISPITNLTNIKYLYLDNNNISNISNIGNLTKLVEISISGNKIQNITSLFNIQTLEKIDASRNKIVSIQNTYTNTNIKKLNINYNNIQTLDGIQNLLNLQVLSASNNKISDITKIAGLVNINNLNLNKNEIKNISAISNLSQLQLLYLDANHILDVNAIEGLKKLSKFTIYNQTYNIVITEKYNSEQLKIGLTNFFTGLKNESSKMYNSNIKYKMDNNVEYQIANNFEFMIINQKDIEKEDLVFRIYDDNNTYMTLVITQEIEEPEPDINTNTTQGETTTNTITNNNAQTNETTNTIIDNNTEISNFYKIENNYIKEIAQKTTVSQFLKNINITTSVVNRKENILKSTEYVGTGDTIKIGNKTYTLIVTGDNSGDGQVTIMDLMKVKRHIVGSTQLNNIQKMASDLNKDNKINITDNVRMIRIIVGN